MPYLNNVTLIGYAGKNPEQRTAQSGRNIVLLSMSTAESWTDKMTGEKKNRYPMA